ncbi:multicopper oxidase family protein [Nocardioides euryhalodurans]|uniref:multicopper oxidase family protein n=1 Tax=Nocardioides euryhalodurans TaxID=2518370 RepID=UPI001FC9D81E|nr:multicopper oxidase family protein [Nocardioides euryhalodurans]
MATLTVVAPLGWMWQSSLLPDSYDLAAMGYADWGGGPRPESGHDHGSGEGEGPGEVAVADLVADPALTADVTAELVVRDEGDRVTVNGSTPGPLLRATEGDLVEVTLVNEDVADGATLHWHGVDVPNAADGVAGVTQDAVMPGEEFVYRFVAEQVGTYWYHSHQVSHEQVQQGLFGGLVVDPADPEPVDVDEVALVHRYGGAGTLNGAEGTTAIEAEPGDDVRLRVVNTDNGVATVWPAGVPFRVLAVDGTEVNGPDEVTGEAVAVPAGGRVDLGFTVPEEGVRVDFSGGTSLTVGSDPTGRRTPAPSTVVDLLHYGAPADPPFAVDDPDRRFDYVIDRRPGFLDGRPGMWWTVNGGLYPDVPMYMVEEGDVVVFEIDNRSSDAHPMHLHGHHGLVLSRDGEPATGSPWWVDSLEVGVGETYEVAVLADNPGVWMDHCHNLPHATEGLVAHLMYAGVRSSFRVGGDHGNHPE